MTRLDALSAVFGIAEKKLSAQITGAGELNVQSLE
jgi:hypothetical protein